MISQIELNLNKEGYKFITNFNINDNLEEIYKIAAKECEIDHKIINEAYDVYGNLLPDYKAFYVHKSHYSLSNFWKVYETYDKRFGIDKK